ncbi:MAG: hypothetical protein ACI4C7_03820 [Clostridia bacterium]
MKKRVILTAVIIGALSELAAVIYTIHIRDKAVIGGEYFILPLFVALAYMVTEIIGTVESNKKTAVRLTRRTKYGDAVLNHEVFPEYDRETLIHEVNCFEPMKTAVEKLCEYEEMGGN